jgi:hypothetical protein
VTIYERPFISPVFAVFDFALGFALSFIVAFTFVFDTAGPERVLPFGTLQPLQEYKHNLSNGILMGDQAISVAAIVFALELLQGVH